MPKNYLVLKNYTLTDRFFVFHEMDKVTKFYGLLEKYLVESAEYYLNDLDEIIIHRETVKHDQEMFWDHMLKIQKLWESEPCNILYMDLDTVFVKPVDIFTSDYKDFIMDGSNCGVRYYPATMNPELFELQHKLMADWDTSIQCKNEQGYWNDGYDWSREQDIFCEMLRASAEWSQDSNWMNPFHSMVWQAFHRYEGQPILHTNGTGHQFDTVKLTKKMYKYSRRNAWYAIENILNNPRHSVRQPQVDWHSGIHDINLPEE